MLAFILLKERNGLWYSASRHDSIEYAQILCAKNISTLFGKRNDKIIVLMLITVVRKNMYNYLLIIQSITQNMSWISTCPQLKLSY